MIKKIFSFLKKYWFLVLLAMIVGGLVTLKLLFPKKPTPSPAPPVELKSLVMPKISGASIPKGFKLEIDEFSFPDQLETYQGQESEISPRQAQTIAEKLGFSGSPEESQDIFLGPFQTWSSEIAFLSVALKSHKIEYGLDLYQVEIAQEGPLPTPGEARENLEKLLADLNLKPQFEAKWQKEKYLTKGFYLQPASSPETADFIQIGLNSGLGQYQLVGSGPEEALISLILGKNQTIISFRSQIYFTGFTRQKTYDLKTKAEIKNSLVGEGKIVSFSNQENPLKEPQVDQLEFNEIYLAYYQEPEKTNLIQPIFILKGGAILADEVKTEVTAYLPALASKYLRFETPL